MTQALYAHMNNKTIKILKKECVFLFLLPLLETAIARNTFFIIHGKTHLK
jgi:hypothetical protein